MVTQETTIWPGEIPAVSERRDVVEVASRRVRQGRVDGLAASEQPWPLTDLGALTACAPQSAGLGGACAVVPQRILCAPAGRRVRRVPRRGGGARRVRRVRGAREVLLLQGV